MTISIRELSAAAGLPPARAFASGSLRDLGFIGRRDMPQYDVDMRLLDARMAGIVVDIDMVDIPAGRGQILEALVRIEILDLRS
jgi:hypothetical protein